MALTLVQRTFKGFKPLGFQPKGSCSCPVKIYVSYPMYLRTIIMGLPYFAELLC